MADQALRIDPIRPRLRWQVLTPADVERLEQAILETLAEVGVRFPLERALDALERGGCRVDRASQVARLPEDVVRAALQAAPTAPLLAARDPRCDIVLDGTACHLSNDGCGVRVVDPETGELRPSTRQDVADSARFVDAAPAGELLLGAGRDRRGRPARDPAAARGRGDLRQHEQALPGRGRGRRGHDAPRRRDGARGGRRRRGAPPPADHESHRLSDRPARQRGREPRGGAGLRGGRRPRRLPLADARLCVRAGDHGRQSRRQPGGRPRRDRPAAAGVSGRARVPGRRALRDGPQDRRLHRRQPRGLRPGRRRHAAGASLRLRHEHGHHGERRQGAGLAGRRGRRALDAGQRLRRRRDDERLRPARRLEDPELRAPAHGGGGLRHRAEGRRRHRGETTRRWRWT